MNLQEIGYRIRYVRTEMTGLSQREFVQRMGLGQSNISNVEKGISLPSCFFLCSLHITYDININWLLTGSGDVSSKPSPNDWPLGPMDRGMNLN